MYVPQAFAVDDPGALFACAEANPFATIVTSGDDGPLVGHLPLLVDARRRVLRGHVARANAQFSHFAAGKRALAIFHGPHGYVSPSAYATREPSVPTWNYIAVHLGGPARVLDEAGLRDLLEDSVARFDETGWQMPKDEDFLRRMIDAVAGFEIEVVSLSGKWKLSQNRSAEDQTGVVGWLARGDASSRALADIMRRRV